jgi:hypothetical protein
MRIDRLLGEWRIEWDVPGAGRQFAVVMEGRRQAELGEEFKQVHRDWCLGSEEFRAEMLKYVETQTGKWHYGAELRESAQAKAERLIGETLHSEGVSRSSSGELAQRSPLQNQAGGAVAGADHSHDGLDCRTVEYGQ